ncbi:MAG: hypothetical protein A3B74_01095 [Candidatus Kerfeldbacteria bacterium RIFCSPHIGHO2_02_FULL_42_14]|uniref:HTH merR-type domain-containing protein n=1 Tax=Candidatus Kerfeldbacteria bacterium RIFCSPHIGHO2_02_FULL_42_14 TaxID=1798540 RepID=A0A1G2AR80_9BACT|nr:MAG: hypothetical protein A3B74_01095 [Candidatus Kerfeldbacteria bacterium RIFCSPHIGHO2_02_FULL_42_14]OGY81946.1 MAG: hypothetical protein A3E60_01175 [Candidatus Kerfeldbacteria bacterium RIFCSPHIGHO2_12_FULL_42_13]OGY83419.1 MAG: hypothetical protein A3I91_02080 [Candidatus Kerfeldbacteria bacterium RIFCSPLOWO2_02_FULL_42_19]OGY85570.1 MAG: hypothetical protein A3G01_03740 [Candidatus Kerfeldbacteria bacterium RIFCSPLOWO2_12_FULL_43_9]
MDHNLITIQEAAEKLGISLQTLRRWDTNGKLKAIRSGPYSHRYYKREDVEKVAAQYSKNLFHEAQSWVTTPKPIEPAPHVYCPNSGIFQARISNFETQPAKIPHLQTWCSLIIAVTGEIGNNSFDHNLGNWPDIPGIFFGYDLAKKHIVLADRGQGILKTLKRVRQELQTHTEALKVAFTEIISGRSPESRGNGLKFIRQIISTYDISLRFLSGNAQVNLRKRSEKLLIQQKSRSIHGCLAFITFS